MATLNCRLNCSLSLGVARQQTHTENNPHFTPLVVRTYVAPSPAAPHSDRTPPSFPPRGQRVLPAEKTKRRHTTREKLGAARWRLDTNAVATKQPAGCGAFCLPPPRAHPSTPCGRRPAAWRQRGAAWQRRRATGEHAARGGRALWPLGCNLARSAAERPSRLPFSASTAMQYVDGHGVQWPPCRRPTRWGCRA